MSKTPSKGTSDPERHFIFKWVVQDFSKTPGILESGVFAIAPEFPKNWCFTIACVTEDSACFTLKYDHLENKKLRVFMDVSVHNTNGVLLLCRTHHHVFGGEPEQVELFELNLDCALPEDLLHFRCKMTVHGYDIPKDFEVVQENDCQDLDIIDLKHDLFKMLYEGEGANIQIKCRRKSMRVHRCILNHRVPFLISKHIKEIEKGEVKLDFDFKPVRTFFEYVYTAEVTNLGSVLDCMTLYVLGLTYKLPGLRAICEKGFYEMVNADNVCSILDFADSSNMKDLMSYCVEFGRLNSEKLKSSLEWLLLMESKPHLKQVVTGNASMDLET